MSISDDPNKIGDHSSDPQGRPLKEIKDILYFVAAEMEAELRLEMRQAGAQEEASPTNDAPIVIHKGRRTFRFTLVTDIERALALLRAHYYNFITVDGRSPGQETWSTSSRIAFAQNFVDTLHYNGDPEQRYPLSRIVVVLPETIELASQAFDLGRLRVAGFVTLPFEGHLFTTLEAMLEQESGKSAICLAGGGIEGFLFEVGVMLALNAHLQSHSVTATDIFCGISAGSILSALLANQIEPELIANALSARRGNEGLEALSPRVLYDFHFGEYLSRFWSLTKKLPVRSFGELFSTLIKTVPTGFFRGNALHDFVERQLTREGRTNDFRTLKRELYIGATDQDTSTHVIFGDGQWKDVPISLAVRASSALTPFFEPALIRGRYFVDGQYTRTSNFHIAVERGAKLVIIVDPLVPIRAGRPGYVRSKGGIFGGLQALKAVIHTRFLHAYQSAIDNYPDVDFVLFRPEGDMVRVMSGSPMKYGVRKEIVSMAFRTTVRRIQRDFEVLQGTFAKHGLELQRHPRLRTPHQQIF